MVNTPSQLYFITVSTSKMDQRQAKLNQRLDREAAFRAAKAEATHGNAATDGIWCPWDLDFDSA